MTPTAVNSGVSTRNVRVTSPRLPSPEAIRPSNAASSGLAIAQTAMR